MTFSTYLSIRFSDIALFIHSDVTKIHLNKRTKIIFSKNFNIYRYTFVKCDCTIYLISVMFVLVRCHKSNGNAIVTVLNMTLAIKIK